MNIYDFDAYQFPLVKSKTKKTTKTFDDFKAASF